jgi:tripartite-type tricarboxylate transporter receptor subunit TctC
MRLSRRILAFLACATLPASLAGAAEAQTVEDFYRGKTIQVMIGYTVGGTDDAWARLIARYLSGHMPGHPTAVPTNVPGAGSLLLANQLYNTQPKDGTVFGLFNRGVPFEPLLGGTGVRFDALKFNYLGSPDLDTLVCVVRNDAPVQTLEDLKTRELVVGATGSGADRQTYPEVLAHLLGLKMKLVQGYPGSRDILLAVERNEVQGGCVSYDTIARNAMFRAGKSHIIFQAALKPDPRIAGAPLVTDLATTQDQKEALRLFLQRTMVGRPFAAPPGVPADRVAALRAGFKGALEDPGLRADAAKAGLHLRFVPPSDLEKVIADAYKASPAVVALTRKAFGR